MPYSAGDRIRVNKDVKMKVAPRDITFEREYQRDAVAGIFNLTALLFFVIKVSCLFEFSYILPIKNGKIGQ